MEEWKFINGYENYKISDHGNVKNIITNKMLNLALIIVVIIMLIYITLEKEQSQFID